MFLANIAWMITLRGKYVVAISVTFPMMHRPTKRNTFLQHRNPSVHLTLILYLGETMSKRTTQTVFTLISFSPGRLISQRSGRRWIPISCGMSSSANINLDQRMAKVNLKSPSRESATGIKNRG